MAILLLLITIVLPFALTRWFKRAQRPLPPGPTPLPVIGNVLQLSRGAPLLTLKEWTATFGPIVSFRIGSRTAILLGSQTVVQDLLERKARRYSSRPRFIAIGESIMDGLFPAFMPYHGGWQAQNRLRSHLLNSQTAKASSPLLLAATTRCLHDMVNGADVDSLSVMVSARVLLPLLHGTDPSRVPIDCGPELRGKINIIVASTSPEHALLDMFPALEYIPGISWALKRKGATVLDACTSGTSKRIEKALQQPSWNFTQALYERRPAGMSWKAFCVFVMELEVTSANGIHQSMCNIVRMAAAHPQEMQKVQAEIDGRTGGAQPPTMDDLPSLPYLNAFIQESMRLNSILPLGFPHTPTEDDDYKGYLIPQGAFVLPFVSGINTDETIYRDPMVFHPQRWIDNPTLPRPATFGYGKRLCPGQPFALDMVTLTMARMLWGFTFKETGASGHRSDVDHLLVRAAPLGNVTYVCRSEAHQATIEREAEAAIAETESVLSHIRVSLGL